MKAASEKGDVDLFMKNDKAFDYNLMTASKNTYAYNAVLPMHMHCRRFWYYYKKNNDLSEPAQRHVDIMNFVCDRNENASVEASNLLINYLVDFTKKAIF